MILEVEQWHRQTDRHTHRMTVYTPLNISFCLSGGMPEMSWAAAARCSTPTTSPQSSGDSDNVTVWFLAPAFSVHKDQLYLQDDQNEVTTSLSVSFKANHKDKMLKYTVKLFALI